MNFEISDIAIVGLSFLTATVSGAVGMAGGILLLGGMSFFMPLSSIIPVHGIVQLGSNGMRSLLLRKHIEFWILIPFVIGAVIGGYCAYNVLINISLNDGFLIFIFVIIVYVLFKPKQLPDIKLNKYGFFGLGLTAGALGPIIGATGPLLAPFFIRKDLDQRGIVASKASCQISIHFMKVPIFLLIGFEFVDKWILIVSMLIATYFGTRLGVKLLHRIDRELFFKYIRLALGLVLCRIGWKIGVYFEWFT